MKLLGVVFAGLVACGGPRLDEPVTESSSIPVRSVAPDAAVDAGAPARPTVPVASNLLRADYAGSATCGDCHASIHAAWQKSPMHRMTRTAGPGEIRAPFDGATLHFGTDLATMETRDGARYVRVVSPVDGDHVYRVTKVIGGRRREDYVGVDVTGGAEQILPVSYIVATQSWRYKGYSLLVTEHDRLRTQANWSQTCIACHNTLPQLTTLYGLMLGPEAPATYQGTYTDNQLPASRAWRLVPTDDAGLARAVSDEVTRIGGKTTATALQPTLQQAVLETRRHLGEDDFVELGIGCESCHGGSAEHVKTPDVMPSFEPRSSLLRAEPPGGGGATRAQWINRACARCHTLLVSVYPWTWEGGRRDAAVPGGTTMNSGEGRDFMLGGCASQMSCATCHDPHGGSSHDKLEQLATPAGNATCTSCHPKFASEAGLRAHTHHEPGAGSACIACHMPKKQLGLTYELSRYHRIGAPTDSARVEGDRPLECALCHRDKSVNELVGTMERWWSKRFDRPKLRALYGANLDVNALAATLARGKPHEQGVAIGVLGERGTRDDVTALVPQLWNPYPQLRYMAKHAIEKLTGEPLSIDVGRPAAEIVEQVRRR